MGIHDRDRKRIWPPRVTVNYAPQIDASGADASAVAKLAQVMAQERLEFQSKVVGAVRLAKRRRQL
jgi:hypothetical protein